MVLSVLKILQAFEKFNRMANGNPGRSRDSLDGLNEYLHIF